MATSQVILPGQIVLNGWVSWSMMEGLTLLGPPNCPASWPASVVKRVSAEPTKKATPVVLTTPVKRDTPSGSGKGRLPLGSSGKKSVPPLDEHEKSVLLLTSKAVPSRVSQAPGLPTHAPSEGKRG